MTDAEIEAVARAICDADGHDPNHIVMLQWRDKLPSINGPQWKKYISKSEAAIAALDKGGYLIKDGCVQVCKVCAHELPLKECPAPADYLLEHPCQLFKK